MRALVSLQQFYDWPKKKQYQYVIERLNLEGNYLVGTVDKVSNDPPVQYMTNIINPYTGEYIRHHLLSDYVIEKDIYITNYQMEKHHLNQKQKWLFQFNINYNKDNLVDGRHILIMGNNAPIPIENAQDVLRELDIRDDLLLKMEKDMPFKDTYYISDFYRYEMKNEIEAYLEQKKEQLSEKEATIRSKSKKMQRLHRQFIELGFMKEEKSGTVNEQATIEKIMVEDENEWLQAVLQQIAKRGFIYSEEKLRQFYTSLKTNQLTILSGPSGTGKTSLVTQFAKATDSKVKMIPVQPSWTDKQDLLGFYNPLEKQYVPSLFLDALTEAKEHKDQLYLICLDEINLAQIEYYFADVLSVREQTDSPIELYSKYEYDTNMEEIKWYLQQKLPQLPTEQDDLTQIETLEEFRYAQRYRNLQRYHWQLEIPENVRFIGTMNIDGTVRPLSPKVVDRSFIVHIPRQEETDEENKNIPEMKAVHPVQIEKFSQSDMQDADDQKRIKRVKKSIDTLYSILTQLDAGFNTRIERHIELYITYSQTLGVSKEKMIDEVIAMKLLPRLNKMIEPDELFTTLYQQMKELVGEETESITILQNMIDQAERTNVLSYWS